jgi:hypothetical protein
MHSGNGDAVRNGTAPGDARRRVVERGFRECGHLAIMPTPRVRIHQELPLHFAFFDLRSASLRILLRKDKCCTAQSNR